MEHKRQCRPGDGASGKSLWQLLKFILVSGLAGIIQLALANLLPLVFDGITTAIPGALRWAFRPEQLFDRGTVQGAADYARYVADGAVTWGYVLPFFLSNAIANVYGYFQNKKTTFRSNAPKRNFVIYFVILAVLILVSTWLQGVVFAWVNTAFRAPLVLRLARTIAAAAAGLLQLIVLFPLEKFVLLKSSPQSA